jgi:hypothetical protein
MTFANVQIDQKSLEILIKAAAAKNVSVEKLASEILSEAIQTHFSEDVLGVRPKQNKVFNPLTNLQPYAFHAKPEESALSSDEWSMESEEA